MNPSIVLDHFGVSVSAVSGVLAARGKGFDLFGVITLALVTALGGGTIRDVLAGAGAVGWLTSPALLTTVFSTAVIGFLIFRKVDPQGMWLQIADALALCAFAVAGTRKGLQFGFDPVVSITLGVITGVAGGIVRDTLTGQVPLVFQKETSYYATAAFFGGLLFCLSHGILGDDLAAWISLGSALLLRLGAIRYRLTLPVFEPRFKSDP